MRASVVPVPTIADLAIRALPWDPAEHLNQAARRMRGRQSRTLGFPGNANVDLSAYGSLLSVLFNNVGDPQSTDASNIGAKTYELAVLEYFAHVAGADPAQVFGYVASSSSEALLHGLYTARQALPDAVVYASDQAHYSVARACEVLRVEMVTVASRPDGSMDPQDLAEQAALRARGGSTGSGWGRSWSRCAGRRCGARSTTSVSCAGRRRWPGRCTCTWTPPVAP
ncbi:hypothetical protein ACIF70_40440 [Actinacidiphila glaucinigra]|uniref:hypothetical protein n=1 Tax=Actinacidiphila glaucinigra TaxID=235986 RepID=UPI0037CB5B61